MRDRQSSKFTIRIHDIDVMGASSVESLEPLVERFENCGNLSLAEILRLKLFLSLLANFLLPLILITSCTRYRNLDLSSLGILIGTTWALERAHGEPPILVHDGVAPMQPIIYRPNSLTGKRSEGREDTVNIVTVFDVKVFLVVTAYVVRRLSK